MIRSLGWVWYCLTSTLSDPCGWLAPLQWPRVYLCMADWYVGWVSGAWPLCLSNLYKFILHSACTTNIIILIINNTPATIISCVWGRGRNWRHWHPLLIWAQSHIWSELILDQVVWLSQEFLVACFFGFSRFQVSILWFQIGSFGYSRFQGGFSWFQVGFMVFQGSRFFFIVLGRFLWLQVWFSWF